MDLLLPPIDIEKLPAETRDWLLAKAAQLGVSPQAIIERELIDASHGDGFHPKKAA